MADPTLTAPDGQSLNLFHRALGKKLRDGDAAPKSLDAWKERRTALREAMFKAMGPFPEKPSAIEAKTLGTLKRDGYRIELLLIQTRPDVWMTASAYVPEGLKDKAPSVLSVHGHFKLARRDPVIQSRCLVLVKQGYFVLSVDAFGAGERFMEPKTGGYHGALIGSTLWPVGQTLLGLQIYDNRRAVDYMLTRPEVDGNRLAITGESGGGNQTMNAGSLDDRFAAVVPVCSVGNYQAYLQAACCVCEVLPGALTFTEEGDVLGLVAPRALMVINATKDSFQFSVDEAKKSLARAGEIYKLYEKGDKVKHVHIEAGHGYNQAMREAMYGGLAKWLKNEGKGEPIEEPKFDTDKPEDLACFPDGTQPKGFLFPASFAAFTAGKLLKHFDDVKPDHPEEWESTAVALKSKLKKTLGVGALGEPLAEIGKPVEEGKVRTTQALVRTEGDLALPVELRFKTDGFGKMPSAIVLDLDGQEAAGKNALVSKFLDKGFIVVLPELRGTGKSWPATEKARAGSDHDPAEHGLWVGRPLLGQWVTDVIALLDWLDLQPGHDKGKRSLIAVGQAGLVGLCAAALSEDRVASLALEKAPVGYVTREPYAAATRMGLLAPGLLQVGDVPHLVALLAPRPVQVAGGVTPLGEKVEGDALKKAFAFTTTVYQLHKAEKKFEVGAEVKPEAL